MIPLDQTPTQCYAGPMATPGSPPRDDGPNLEALATRATLERNRAAQAFLRAAILLAKASTR